MLRLRFLFALSVAIPFSLLPLAGCNSNALNGGASCTADVDTDGDGLNNDAECDLGSDPTLADTDGDGVSDGDEVKQGTDPKTPDTSRPKIPGCVGPCVVNYNC